MANVARGETRRNPSSVDPDVLLRTLAKNAPGANRRVLAKDPPRREERSTRVEPGMDRYRIETGHDHGAEPRSIVGAIANEAGLQGRDIGRISIYQDHSHVDLPEGMPREVLKHLKRVWVGERQLNLRKVDARNDSRGAPRDRNEGRRSSRREPTKHEDRKPRSFSGRGKPGKRVLGKNFGKNRKSS